MTEKSVKILKICAPNSFSDKLPDTDQQIGEPYSGHIDIKQQETLK